MTSLVIECWKVATVLSSQRRETNENAKLAGRNARADEPYVFVPGSVPREPADHSPPISGTSSGAGRVIMTVDKYFGSAPRGIKGLSPGSSHSREYHPGTSAPKRAFSFFGLVGGRDSIEKPRDLGNGKKNKGVSCDRGKGRERGIMPWNQSE